MSNIWHLVLSTGFPRAPLGIESKLYWQTQLLSTQEGASAPPANRGALCSQTVGHTAGSLMLWPLSSHHPFQDIKQPTYRGPPTWLPFLPSKVASASIIYWATCRGPKAETELESLHHQGVDDAGQCFLLLTPHALLHLATLFGTILLPLSLPAVLKSQWDLLPPLFTDPP